MIRTYEHREPTSPRVIAEEAEFLAVEKPAGMLTHPLTQSGSVAQSLSRSVAREPTLVSWLLTRYPELTHIGPDPLRPGIVHRLDREVSGVMVVARTPEMYEHMVREFTERRVKKEYTALVHGKVSRDYGTIDFPLARGAKGTMVAHPTQHSPLPVSSANRERAEGEGGSGSREQYDPHPHPLPASNTGQGEGGVLRDAVTEFEVIRRWPHKTLLRVMPKTGRMHQIRAHMKAIGHPVVGDKLYAIKRYREKVQSSRLMLHAERIAFADREGKWREYEAPPPYELKNA